MRCLVTGGCGFIGSHICEGLVKAGHDVTVFDNLSTGNRSNLAAVANAVQIVEGDIRDADAVSRCTRNIDCIFHEAALVSVPISVEDPQSNHDINISGTLNVLLAARTHGVKRLIFAASAAAYGDSPLSPKLERMLPEPKSPYAVAKVAGEHYLRVFSELYGLETVALRYFNVYGPRQDPASPYSGVISRFCDAITAGRNPTIFGDGTQTRDFVFVGDVARANLLAANMPAPARGDILNIGTGQGTTLLDLVETLATLSGRQIQPEFHAIRAGDVRTSVADTSAARARLGYAPQIPLREGLSRLLASIG